MPGRGKRRIDAALAAVVPDLTRPGLSRPDRIEPAVDGGIRRHIDQEYAVRRPGKTDNLVCRGIVQFEQAQAAFVHVEQSNGAQFIGIARVTAPYLVRIGLRGQVIGKRHATHLPPVHVVYSDVAAIRRPCIGRSAPDARPDLPFRAVVAADCQRRQRSNTDVGERGGVRVVQIDEPEVTVSQVSRSRTIRGNAQFVRTFAYVNQQIIPAGIE